MKNTFTLKNFYVMICLFVGLSPAMSQIVTSDADDGSPGTLRAEIADASAGSVITFSPTVLNITLMSEITIDKSLTITGNGLISTTIDGDAAGRIFNITDGEVVLNDLNITDGLAENGGAIMIVGANVVLNSCTVTNSTANGASGSGGGIYVGADATFSAFNSTISGNVANRAGGGIESIAGTTVTLNNVSLTGNNAGVAPATAAPGNGGGFHITGAGNAFIIDGSVTENTAASEGGGLWNGAGSMLVNGTEVSGNTAAGAAADNGGGGIYNLSGSIDIQNADILNNEATGASGSGGGILNDVGGSIAIVNTTISGNTSNRAGGGIENNAGMVMMDDVNLDSNTTLNSPGNGGGLHVTGAGTVNILGGTVNGNSAGAEGGGLWNGTGTMEIDGTTIDANTASGAAADQGGGGIYNLNGGTLMIENAVISNNEANGTLGSGGGILNDVGSQLSVSNSFITGNTAVRAGGGIEDNSGTSTIILTNVILDDNIVTGPPGNGGGLHITGGGNVTIVGGTVTGNTAALEGGGLWNGTGTMIITGTTINDNIADGDAADDGGGGIFNNGGAVQIQDATIAGNYAMGLSGSGGGIFGISGSVSITNSTMTANSANRAGGAIEVIAGSLTLDNSTLTGNDVSGTAGVPNPGNGGGIHITGVTVTLINGGLFSENSAQREGGALWNQTGSTMTLTNVTVDGNTASGPDVTHGGGGIFNNGGDLFVNRSTISNNESMGASGNGGGIHVKSGNATLFVSTVSGNSSMNDGGGIYNNASLIINASTIANNGAVTSGGGLSNNSEGSPSVKNSIIALNEASMGMDVASTTAMINSLGYNIVGIDDMNMFTAMATDIEGTMDAPADPMLGPLADNGGETFTHELMEGSIAYNAGDPSDLFNDQRDSPVFGGIRDIGSYEAQTQLGVGDIVVNGLRSVIYPNPSSNGMVSISLTDNYGPQTKAQVIELGSGKIVGEYILNGTEGQLNLSALSSGIYGIRMSSGNITEVYKLVIQ